MGEPLLQNRLVSNRRHQSNVVSFLGRSSEGNY